ncbi:O-antigen ligase family protein [Maricaulaceae bacterium NA33B04]|nr:O-antigen ligase family protein [Maricaulaceae bacterium NA33B04]
MTDAFALAERWRLNSPRLAFWPALEVGVALLALLLYSQALLGPLLSDPTDPDGAEGLRLIWPPVYLVTAILVAFYPTRVWHVALRSWPLLALASLTLVSATWSIDPGTTVRRGLAVVMPLVFGLWLAARFSWPDMIRLIALMFAVLAMGSAVAGLLFPGFGVMNGIHVGAWKGLWWEKNTLGAMMAWASLSFIAAASSAPTRREQQVWLGLLVLSVALVLLSTSRTALLALTICTLGPATIAVTRRGFGFATLAIFAGLCGVASILGVLFIGPGVILEALGRDATLTGRTDIWEGLIGAIAAQPWTGYGYGVFWSVENGPVFWIRQATAWDVPTAHNAWLETALAIGLPGVALGAFVVLRGLVSSVMRLFGGVETYWTLPFLVAWLGISMSESNLLEQNGLVWLLLCATLAKLTSDRRRRVA